jgi:hypothetical protein
MRTIEARNRSVYEEHASNRPCGNHQ